MKRIMQLLTSNAKFMMLLVLLISVSFGEIVFFIYATDQFIVNGVYAYFGEIIVNTKLYAGVIIFLMIIAAENLLETMLFKASIRVIVSNYNTAFKNVTKRCSGRRATDLSLSLKEHSETSEQPIKKITKATMMDVYRLDNSIFGGDVKRVASVVNAYIMTDILVIKAFCIITYMIYVSVKLMPNFCGGNLIAIMAGVGLSYYAYKALERRMIQVSTPTLQKVMPDSHNIIRRIYFKYMNIATVITWLAVIIGIIMYDYFIYKGYGGTSEIDAASVIQIMVVSTVGSSYIICGANQIYDRFKYIMVKAPHDALFNSVLVNISKGQSKEDIFRTETNNDAFLRYTLKSSTK